MHLSHTTWKRPDIKGLSLCFEEAFGVFVLCSSLWSAKPPTPFNFLSACAVLDSYLPQHCEDKRFRAHTPTHTHLRHSKKGYFDCWEESHSGKSLHMNGLTAVCLPDTSIWVQGKWKSLTSPSASISLHQVRETTWKEHCWIALMLHVFLLQSEVEIHLKTELTLNGLLFFMRT